MGFDLTAFDVMHLVKEWQVLVGGRINKVYQPKETEILLLIYAKGKHMLRIALPSMMYLTQYKGEMPEQQLGFCKFLRKRLNNAVVTRIAQYDFERTVIIELLGKETPYKLIIELFSHGNIILCDKYNKIISLLAARSSEHRELRGGIEYTFPTAKQIHFLNIDKKQCKDLIKNAAEENVSKILAKELGLGGKYAEEILARANQPKERSEVNVDKIFDQIEIIRLEKTQSVIYVENEKPLLISPILLKTQSATFKSISSFNEAIDQIVTNVDIGNDAKVSTEKHKKEVEKATQVLKQQLEILEGREKEIQECELKAQTIYAHYAQLNELLNQMRIVANAKSWNTMKKEFEKNPLVKKIELQKKEVTVVL